MAATTIKRYPLWVIGAVVALGAALALILLTPGIAQAQNLDNEDAALASRAQGSTNDTQITQIKEDDVVAAMSPQQPQAMQQQPAYYEPAEVRVVRPGDTLWSISEQRLQPNPTPEQIMNEVERIYELNRSQIGDNPNLIFAGQQFLLPALYRETAPAAPVPSGPAPSTTPATTVVPPSATTEQVRGSAVAPEELPSTTVVPAQQQQQQAAAPQQQPQAAQEEEQNAVAPEPNTSLGNEQGLSSSDQPTTNPNEEEEQQSASATETNEQPRIVPPWPAAQQQQQTSEQQPTSVAAVADSIAQSFKEFYENSVAERRVLGLGVIALTLGAAVFMVWKLPMKRNVGDPMGWRIPRGGYYYEDSPSSVTLGEPKAVATGAPDATDKQSPNGGSDSDRSSVSSTEQGQADRASTSSRSEDGYLGPEENNGEQDSLSPPFAAPAPPRQRFRSAPPLAPYRGASRRFGRE
jgi:hypothetical protein